MLLGCSPNLACTLICGHEEVVHGARESTAALVGLLRLHGQVDLLAQLLNRPDLAVGLFDHSWVFRGLYLAVEVLLECLEVLVHLLEHVHIGLNVSTQLLDLSFLRYDHLDTTLLRLQPLGKLLNLAIFLL